MFSVLNVWALVWPGHLSSTWIFDAECGLFRKSSRICTLAKWNAVNYSNWNWWNIYWRALGKKCEPETEQVCVCEFFKGKIHMPTFSELLLIKLFTWSSWARRRMESGLIRNIFRLTSLSASEYEKAINYSATENWNVKIEKNGREIEIKHSQGRKLISVRTI